MTSWVISPNWLAWTLLFIIAISLIVTAWAACKIFAVHAIKSNKGLFEIPTFYKGMVWAIGVIEIVIVGIVGYIVFKKVNMTDGSIGGVYMSFFSVLITFLVGWQIYNSILSREQIKGINEDIHNRTSKVLHYNLFHLFFIQGKNEHVQKNYESALNYYFRCMDCANKGCLENELREIILKIKELVNEPQAKVGINDCETYLGIITQISHRDAEYIIQKLETIKNPNVSDIGTRWMNFNGFSM